MPSLMEIGLDLRSLRREHLQMLAINIGLYEEPLYLSVFIDIMLDIDGFDNDTFLGLIDEITIEIGPASPLNNLTFIERLINLQQLKLIGDASPTPWHSEIRKGRWRTLGEMNTVSNLDITGITGGFEDYEWFPNGIKVLECNQTFLTRNSKSVTCSKFSKIRKLTVHFFSSHVQGPTLEFPAVEHIVLKEYNLRNRYPVDWLADFLAPCVELTFLEADWLSVLDIRACYASFRRLEKLYINNPILTENDRSVNKAVKESEIVKLPFNCLLEGYRNFHYIRCQLGMHELISYDSLKECCHKSHELKKLEIYVTWPRISDTFYNTHLEFGSSQRRERQALREVPIPQNISPPQGIYYLPKDMKEKTLVESFFIGLNIGHNWLEEVPVSSFCTFAPELRSVIRDEKERLGLTGYLMDDQGRILTNPRGYEGLLTIDAVKFRSIASWYQQRLA